MYLPMLSRNKIYAQGCLAEVIFFLVQTNQQLKMQVPSFKSGDHITTGLAPSSLCYYLGFTVSISYSKKKKKKKGTQTVQGEPADGGATRGAGRQYPSRSARQTTLTQRGGPLRPAGAQASPRPPPRAGGGVLAGATPAPLRRRRRCQAAARVPQPPCRLLGNSAPQRRSLPAAPARCPRRHCGAAAPQGVPAGASPSREVWGP